MSSETPINSSSQTAVQTTRSGAEVLLVNGLATASLVDPAREGAQWVESVRPRLKQARPGETIVVLGAGSAYHLRALKDLLVSMKHDGVLVAIETCAAAAEFSKARHADVEVLFANPKLGIESFFGDEHFASLMRQATTVLRHRPSLNRQESLRLVESWVLGRTPEAFAAHLKMRPEVAAGLNPVRAAKLAEGTLLSIRDLSRAWDISSELKEDRRLFRVLEELVR